MSHSSFNDTNDIISFYSEEVLLDRDETCKESESIAVLNVSTHVESIKDYIALNIDNMDNDVSAENSRLSSPSKVNLNKSPFNSPSLSINSFSEIIEKDSSIAENEYTLINHITELLNNFEVLHNQNSIYINSRLEKLELENNKLKIKNNDLKENLYNLNDIVYEMDCKLIEVDQYSRRQNLIISGIPDHVEQKNLERKVIEILGSIGMKTCSYDIAACHRLRKNKN